MAADHLKMGGRFSLPLNAVEDDPDTVMKVLEGMIVTRCEYVFMRKEFDYEALHPTFDVLEDGEAVPEYDCEIKEDGTVEWQRKP